MIDLYTAYIITHYHTSNMATIFLDCILGEPQVASPHLAILIYKILDVTWQYLDFKRGK